MTESSQSRPEFSFAEYRFDCFVAQSRRTFPGHGKFVKNIYTVQIVFIFIRKGAAGSGPPRVRVLEWKIRPIGGENAKSPFA